MKLKKILGIFIVLSMVIAGQALGGSIKLALDSPPDLKLSGTYVWASAFSTYLKKQGLTVEEYQRGALGGEAERLDQISTGLLEVSQSDVKVVGGMNPLMFCVILPYFFENAAQLDRALYEGGMLAKINDSTTKKGVRVLSVNHLGLPAGIFNSKHPIHKADDMKDLRMRALDKLQISVFEAWGTNATIVAWDEVPNALQTGIADGYVNPPFVPLLFGHTGFIKHFTDAGIAPSIRLTIASEDWYQGLSSKDRKIVDDGITAANRANREWLANRVDILKMLEAKGIQVVKLTPEARAEFRARSSIIYEKGPIPAPLIAAWEKAMGK
ncbi:MAG: TRAP transporter substrate-binding protein [bacterium]